MIDDQIKAALLHAEPDDIIVFTSNRAISQQYAAMIKETFESRFIGRKALVLGDGLQVSILGVDKRLLRIEAKLDKLFAAIFEEEADEPSTDLEGQQAGGPRDQSETLG